VLDLRRELIASEEYERLEARAEDLRKRLAITAIAPISDPLPEAFEATLGNWLPITGNAGVALLLMVVIEILSTLSTTAMQYLREWAEWEEDVIETTTAVARREPSSGRTRGNAGASHRGGRPIGNPKGSKGPLATAGSRVAGIREAGAAIPSAAPLNVSASHVDSGGLFMDISTEIPGNGGQPLHRHDVCPRCLTACAVCILIGTTINTFIGTSWPPWTDPSAPWRGVFLTIALILTFMPALLALVKAHPGTRAGVSDESASRVAVASGSLSRNYSRYNQVKD
jgi:hypothetical protein